MDDKLHPDLEEGEIVDDVTNCQHKNSVQLRPQPPKTGFGEPTIPKRKTFFSNILPFASVSRTLPTKSISSTKIDYDAIDPTIDVCENEEILRETRKNFMSLSKSSRKRRRKKFREREELKKKQAYESAAAKKQQLCVYHSTGRCTRGNKCPFGHFEHNEKIPTPCPLYSTSHCFKGSKCSYMHGDYPCPKFHMNGSCSDNQKCRFSHDKLTEVTWKIIDYLSHQERDQKSGLNQPVVQSQTPVSVASVKHTGNQTKTAKMSYPVRAMKANKHQTQIPGSKGSKKRTNQPSLNQSAKRMVASSDNTAVKTTPYYSFLNNNIGSDGSDASTKSGADPTNNYFREHQTVVANDDYNYPPNYHSELEEFKESLKRSNIPRPSFKEFTFDFAKPDKSKENTEFWDQQSSLPFGDQQQSPSSGDFTKWFDEPKSRPFAKSSDNIPSFPLCSVVESILFCKDCNLSEILKDAPPGSYFSEEIHRMVIDFNFKYFLKSDIPLPKMPSFDDWPFIRADKKNDDDSSHIIEESSDDSTEIIEESSDDSSENPSAGDKTPNSLQNQEVFVPDYYEDDKSLPAYARVPGILKLKPSYFPKRQWRI